MRIFHSFTFSSNQWIVCQHSPSLQCKTAFDISPNESQYATGYHALTHPAAATISGFVSIVKRETLYILEMYRIYFKYIFSVLQTSL